MTGVLAYLALVIAIPALLCGHCGEDWPLTGACRWAWKTARRALYGRRRPEQASRAPDSTESPQRRSRPSWAHEQPTTYEEAA